MLLLILFASCLLCVTLLFFVHLVFSFVKLRIDFILMRASFRDFGWFFILVWSLFLFFSVVAVDVVIIFILVAISCVVSERVSVCVYDFFVSSDICFN